MSVPRICRRALLGVALIATLSACGGGFKTTYPAPVDAAVSQGWRVAEVRVSVPDTLSVSEAKSLLPSADIVWREDPPGDRHPQVAAIMENAVRQGASGLRGGKTVRIELTMTRFHALTFEAESRLSNAGVHDVEFVAQIVDPNSGTILFGPDAIEASLPAFAGAEAVAARAAGQTQKSVITAHVARVISGWLGTGPDPRTSFARLGG